MGSLMGGLIGLMAVAMFATLGLTGYFRRYAVAKSLIDIPNARSSHSVPTPRGGGVAIVVVFLLILPLLSIRGVFPWSTVWAFMGAGCVVAIVGFLDDHGHIAARWRLLGHFCAAAWALIWLGGLAPISMFGTTFNLGWSGDVFAAVFLVWLLNLYNFMDGIDGIASVEAICVCVGASLLYWLANVGPFAWLPMSLAASVAGFLVWNFPPAKIFMGDAGSGFLGIVLGIFSIQAGWISSGLFYSWLVLLGVFIVDATFTLMRRVIRGDRIYEAHRSHAYQLASRHYGRHLPVTLAVALINLIWLLPISVAIVLFGLPGLTGIVIAYIPLVGLAVYYRAGKVEHG